MAMLGSVILIGSLMISLTAPSHEGVQLSLRGVAIANNSYVDVDDIGEGDNAGLLCHTNKTNCCGQRPNRAGEWYFPNEDMKVEILALSPANNFFYRNRGQRVVRLNRRGSPSERGLFRCEVPNANNVNQTIYVNIGVFIIEPVVKKVMPGENVTFTVTATPSGSTFQWQFNNTNITGEDMSSLTLENVKPQHAGNYTCIALFSDGVRTISKAATVQLFVFVVSRLTISPSDPTPTAGESFSLECSANIEIKSGLFLPTIEWFFGPDNSTLPSGVTTSNVTKSGNIYTRTLQFTPLYEVHNGIYSCRIENITATNIIIEVEHDPDVYISDIGTQIPGEIYKLTCMVTGIGSPNFAITYQWTKKNDTTDIQVGSSNTLFFSPLKLSDAGQYICEVTVGSQMYGAIEYINIEIPVPTFMSVTSNPPSPVRPIGADVTLICTVELSPVVDVPVTLNVQLSDPAGNLLNTTPPSVSGSSIAMISSFGRAQSGIYTCRANISSTSSYLINSRPLFTTKKVTVGVYLQLKGKIYANNSAIFVNEIGETNNNSIGSVQNNALQCITDKSSCCRLAAVGEWYFPNGTVVPRQGDIDGPILYRNRGHDDGTVNLNHINTTVTPSVSTPTGLFCCILPDMDDENQRLCTNIDIVILTITPFGNNIAGEIYNLECSVNGHSSTFKWFDESGTMVTSRGSKITTTSSFSSQLQFSPLHQSHGGTYTCYANVSGVIQSKYIVVSVRVPTVSVKITRRGFAPNLGTNYTLVCGLSGVEKLNATLVYEWWNQDQLLSINSSALHFLPLGLSHAGRYTCRVTITSRYLQEHITISESHEITIKIPAPLFVIIASNKVNPIRPVGSNVTLTCTVELSPAVDVPVTVNTVWTAPAGFMTTNTAQPVMGSTTTYTSTAMVSSFGRDQSGNYTCIAEVTSLQLQSVLNFVNNSATVYGTARVTTGVYLSLKGIVYANNSVISVTEIGETRNSNNGLQCVTDKIPCCQTGLKAGEWYLPNGSLIPEQGSHTLFYINRDDDGTVNLGHVNNSDVASPSGLFCCELPDANDLKQTLCAIIIPTLLVKIRSHGIISTGGQGFGLSCMISGAENLTPTITYQWTKNNGTHMQVGSNSNTLSFSSLRLSDAGQYFCQVTVSSQYLRDNLNVTSTPFDIHLQVPQPVVRLVSDTHNPIHSGSSPILTCAMEFSSAVDVPVNVTTAWTGPDGSTLTSAASPVMRSFTHYTSKAKLNYVESADSGNYTCTVSIGDKTRASVGRKIVIGDGMFQLRLMYTDNCRVWYKSGNHEFELYKYHIEEALIEAIESRCECHFPKGNLLKASFSCSSSPSLTSYRNTLIGTHNFNATQLIGFIQDWVTSAPQINIKDYSVWVDCSCPVALASLKEPECGEVRQCPGKC